MADSEQARPESFESTRRKVLNLVGEVEKKLKESSGRTGCSMFTVLALVPVYAVFFSGMSVPARAGFCVVAWFTTLVVFVGAGMRLDKRKIKTLRNEFDKQFPPESTARIQALQVLNAVGDRGQGVISKLLEELPLADRVGMSAEDAAADINRRLDNDPFPPPASSRPTGGNAMEEPTRSRPPSEFIPLEPDGESQHREIESAGTHGIPPAGETARRTADDVKKRFADLAAPLRHPPGSRQRSDAIQALKDRGNNTPAQQPEPECQTPARTAEGFPPPHAPSADGSPREPSRPRFMPLEIEPNDPDEPA